MLIRSSPESLPRPWRRVFRRRYPARWFVRYFSEYFWVLCLSPFMLAYIALGLQIALRGFFEIHDSAPNLVLIVVALVGGIVAFVVPSVQ